MKLDNDVPCANCRRIDGAPELAHYFQIGEGYTPSAHVSVCACSHCVDALQARLDAQHPIPKVGAR